MRKHITYKRLAAALVAFIMALSPVFPAFAEELPPEATEEVSVETVENEEIPEEVSEETTPEETSEEAENPEETSESEEQDSEETSEETTDIESEKTDKEPRTFRFEDSEVIITASETEAGLFPEDVVFDCEKIDEKSDEYLDIHSNIEDLYELSSDRIEIVPYDVRFISDGEEVEPEDGAVDIKFEFKEPVKVDSQEDVSVVHMENGTDPEIVAEDVADGNRVEEFEISLETLSPVVLTRANVPSSPLKSIQMEGEDGTYWISKTPNINNNGVGQSYYSNSQNLTDTVSADGALWLDVEVRYGGERVNYDYLYIKDASDNIFYADSDGLSVGSTASSYRGRIGGGVDFNTSYTNQYKNPQNTLHYRFDTDTLKFVWRTDGSGQGYGYYAIITPHYPEGDVPDFHVEELEDGTYALVFDKGGDIDAFMVRPEVKERLADYKNSISEIRLHKDTTAIKNGAFKNLPALKTVTFPRNSQVSEIGKSVFAGCDGLEEITIPASVESIGKDAFRGCSSLEKVSFAPGSPVTELPAELFSGLKALKHVDLPEGLAAISDNMFDGCTSLVNIDIPESVTSVGTYAFRDTGIKDASFLEHVTTIKEGAFTNCKGLTDITITGTTTSIGPKAFENCSNVTDFIFEDDTSFPTLPTSLFSGMTSLRNVKLPNDLTRIPDYCFQNCSNLQMVDIPDSVTKIGNYSFTGCSKLRDFDIPSQVKEIGNYAFRSCTSLRNMEIPNTVTSIGSGIFYSCNGLIKAEFEEGSPITSLPSEMFYGCSKLETIRLPDGVTAIPSSYFRDCSSLRHVDLPENLTSIGSYAFYSCTSLEEVPLSDKLKTIGNYAFYNCDSLTEVVVPRSVTSVGSECWRNCDSLTSVVWEEGSPLTSIGAYTFTNCKNLEELVLPEKLTSIPNYMAQSCTKLRNVEIPPRVTKIGSYAFDGCTLLNGVELPAACTGIDTYAFRSTGLTEIDLPDNLGYIGNYAFYGTKMTDVTIPNQVTSVGQYAFTSSPNLESVTFEEGGKACVISQSAFSNCNALKDVTLKDNITRIDTSAFYNNRRLEEMVIPSGTTSIGSSAFSNDTGMKRLVFENGSSTLSIDTNNNGNTFANMSVLEELVIDRNITSSYTKTNNFANINPNTKVVIGKHVDTLDNMFVSLFTRHTNVVFEGENDFSVSTRIDNRSEDAKWSELKGDFYVDENGVVYKLDKSDNTASLFHIPAGLTSYTVPETITSVAGVTYTIDKIESHAVREASDLAALTVEKPENIIVPQFAFSDCPTLVTINDKTEIFPEEWSDVSLLCGFPVHSDQESEQVPMIKDTTIVDDPSASGDVPPAFSFGVTISGQEKMGEDELTYIYPTGMSARLDFAISNESNVDMSDRVIRIYFAFDGDNYTMGNYSPDQNYTLVNTATGSRYPFKVRSTDAKGVYYYDITGFKPGDTLAFNNQFGYLSPSSAGGTFRVWAESISAEEAAAMEGKVSQPGKYILAEWYTKPTPYTVSKAVNGNPTFQFVSGTDDDDDNIYVSNISYKIDMTSAGASGTSYAKDHIKYVDFSDDLVLTENMIWNPEVIEAVRTDNYYVNSSGQMFAKLDGKWVCIATITGANSSLMRDIRPEIVTDDNGNEAIRLNWSYRNSYWTDSKTAPTAELPACSFIVRLEKDAVVVKHGSDLWSMFREGADFSQEESEAMRKVANKVAETSHYSFSEDQFNEAEAAQRLVYANTGFSMSKTMPDGTYFGGKHGFDIKLNNTGLVHKTDVDIVTDSMVSHYYIKPEDMEAMFRDKKWGPHLKVDVTSVTLCEKPEREAVDVSGNAVPAMTAQQSGIDPIPYSGCASTDNSVITQSAKLSFEWNEDRTHLIMKVMDDGGTVQQTKTIGDGCDYETIREAVDDIGYVVTYRAAYKVTWDLGDNYTLYNAVKDGMEADSISDLTPEQISQYEYKLRSGKSDTFRILSTTKDTTMMLTKDEPGQYPSNSLSSSNTAYARNDQNIQVGSASWNNRIYRELFLSKSAYANGQSWSQNMQIPDDTVVDYTLTFTNYGDKHDVLPLTDHMTGSQVLLVPVRGNKDALFIPAGSTESVTLEDAGLDIYSDSGVKYYILDKSGEYKGVTIDGRVSDTIKVSRTLGNADTLMIWYYRNVNGTTLSGSGTTKSITYKALADSSRLGTVTQGGSTVTRHALGNESWLGGHQTHRLYASLNGETEQAQFIKWIVEDPEDENENLIRHSLIQNSDEVLYKIIIENTGKSGMTLTGNQLRDELPSTAGVFPWTKEDITDIYYVTHDAEVNEQSRDAWYVDSIEPTGADTASRGLYYIHWNNDFRLNIDAGGDVWIYVKLQFPGSDVGTADAWDDYIAVNNGSTITNYYYIGERQSHVTHELVDVTEGLLQKGVLDTGLSRSGYFQSESTRDFYQNGGNADTGSVQEVAYYTVLYNSGNVRLYLDDFQDQLPKGIKFRGLFNCIPKAAATSTGFSTVNDSNGYYNSVGNYVSRSSIRYLEYFNNNSQYIPVATVTDGEKNIVYKNARITAAVSEDSEGHQQVRFTPGRETNSDNNLKYDSTLGKYYLDPGEAIRFGYNCTVEGYKRTENIANNEITMPVFDKYGLGVHMSEDVTITPAMYRDITPNDGGCSLNTTEEEVSGNEHVKPEWAKNTTDWFSSNVSLRRLAAVPGVQKTVGGETRIPTGVTIKPNEIYGSKYSDGNPIGTAYTGTVARTSIVNWRIRAFNEGGIGSNSLEDYWIEDTVDAPYMFTGNYFYDYYNVNGTKMTSSSVPVFSLGGRSENDTTVRISTGDTLNLNSTITVNGPAVSVNGGRAQVQLLRDEHGTETLRIHFADNAHRIPPNSYMELYAHTQYVSSDAVLSKQFYNHVELQPTKEFDPALVSQGKVLYRDESGEPVPYAIESGASVTMTAGYSSAARKQVTEIANTSNTGWSDKAKNYIMLPGKYSTFRYDLYVDLPKDDPTSKLVLIDSLPEPDDHSPFVDRDYRDSEFTVHMLSEDLGLNVWTITNLGQGTRTQIDDYTFEVSEKTSFVPEDWDAAGEGWSMIDFSDGLSEEETHLIENARSFRIVLEDPDLIQNPQDAMMGRNTQVQVRFNAEILTPEEADPGAIAWNSFGYRYTVPIGATGISTSLNAEPLRVGVLIPAVPFINKDLKTPNDHYRAAEEDAEYRFLVYSGSSIPALNDITGMTMADIAAELGSRDVLLTSLTIQSGKATGKTDFLDEEMKWVYDPDRGDFVETDEHWVWQNQSKYTIIELPWDENGFVFDNTQHSPVNNYTFSQNAENNVSLRVTNVWDNKGDLLLSKTVDGPSADPNRKFTFTIHLQDGKYPVYGSFDYEGTNIRNGTLIFSDTGNAVVQLKHNQSIRIRDIPSGYTYSVTEGEDNWYTSHAENEEGVIIKDEIQNVSFRNTRKSTTLSATKTVQGNFGDRNKLFEFEVYIIDEGRELTGTYNAHITHQVGAAEDITLTFTEGASRFRLKHGDRITIYGLPVGARYEVDELPGSRTGYDYTAENESGALTEAGQTASYVNTMWGVTPTGVASTGGLLILAIAVTLMIIGRKKRLVEE